MPLWRGRIKLSNSSRSMLLLVAIFRVMGTHNITSTKVVRMLHTSDVHIGYVKGPGLEHRAVCQCVAQALAITAVNYNVDVILVAGDLFDHGRLESEVVLETLEILTKTEIPVVIIPGNHDVHDQGSLWERCHEEVSRSGVLLLQDMEGSQLELLGGDLTIWGRAMAEHEPGYRPFSNSPKRPTSGWYVVAGHGHLNLTSDDAHRSSPITYQEIRDTDADYVALGHWHVLTDASYEGVKAWYPGAPMGKPGNGSANLIVFGESVSVECVAVKPSEQGC